MIKYNVAIAFNLVTFFLMELCMLYIYIYCGTPLNTNFIFTLQKCVQDQTNLLRPPAAAAATFRDSASMG